jgi:hypothetical protein
MQWGRAMLLYGNIRINLPEVAVFRTNIGIFGIKNVYNVRAESAVSLIMGNLGKQLGAARHLYSFNQTLKKEGASHIELFFHYSFDRLGNSI